MKNYYLVSGKNDNEDFIAVAERAEEKVDDARAEVDGLNELPFHFTLKAELGHSQIIARADTPTIHSPLDYLPNSLSWPLVSSKMKNVIESIISEREKVDWIGCKVFLKHSQWDYYVLRFGEKLDVLDQERTLFVPNTRHIIRPCFSLEKIRDLHLFTLPLSHNLWKINSSIYVS